MSARIDALDLCFVGGLGLLSSGTWLAYDLGTALVVSGGVLTGLGLFALLRKVL